MLHRRLLGQSGDRLDLPSSLHLAEMDKGDVWNLIVDTGSPSNFAERYHDIPNILQCSYIPPFLGKQRFSGRETGFFCSPWLHDCGNLSSPLFDGTYAYPHRYKKAMEGEEEQEDQEEDGDGIRTEQLEFVANGVMYSVQTSNRAEVKGRWKGSPEVS